VFVGGAYLYVHVAGGLFARSHHLSAPLLLVLALVGGAASFFSPCSIAITPSFIGYLSGAAHGPSGATRRLGPAGLVAVGIVAFYAAAGAAVGAIGSVVYNYLVYLVAVIGAVFLLLGYLLLTGRGAALMRLGAANQANRYYEVTMASAPGAHPRARLVGFGVAYGAASHTCTLPIFLGLVLAPIAAGAFVLAGGATLLYGLAIAALLLVMALVGDGALSGIRRRMLGHYLGLLTGGLFLLTGGYLLYYFVTNYGGFLLLPAELDGNVPAQLCEDGSAYLVTAFLGAVKQSRSV
ncbi:MAG: cytochrome c biogenesis protein CcdA, partial [Acidimicrobiales bacterium]